MYARNSRFRVDLTGESDARQYSKPLWCRKAFLLRRQIHSMPQSAPDTRCPPRDARVIARRFARLLLVA